MSHEAALIELILENPEMDGPRLVYADWLEEQGEADRAEFIRVQCELARLESSDPRRPELASRERRLLLDHARDWEPRFDAPFIGWGRFEFRRGFAEYHTDVVTLLGLQYHFSTPIPVPAVHLEPFGGYASPVHFHYVWQHLPVSPCLGRVASLRLPLDNDQIDLLLNSAYLTHLRCVHVEPDHLTDAGVVRLASARAMAGVTRLVLANHGISDTAAEALADSPLLTSLTDLVLSGNRIGNAGAEALANSPYLTNLKNLDLGSNQIGQQGAQALAASSFLGRMESLYFSYNFPGPGGEAALRQRFGPRVRFR
jgi:uncharacterized protein (TIGR02996 family)